MELVSVIVPAFNAAATLDETLSTIRTQTYRALEIIVVDDGSSDGTACVAMRHADEDARVRLISQGNAGVAAARNRGAADSQGQLLTFVDADDLCAPTRIERQVEALSDEGAALAYTWSALIDEESRVLPIVWTPRFRGDVLAALCCGNFIGNGSAVLVTKEAFEEAGGFDTSLRDASAQGCEDYKFYLAVAERHEVALVPEFLTGYRQVASNMSSDVMQMFRSWTLVREDLRNRRPDLSILLDRGDEAMSAALIRIAMAGRQYRSLPRLGVILARRAPRRAVDVLFVQILKGRLRRVLRAAGPLTQRPIFPMTAPEVGD